MCAGLRLTQCAQNLCSARQPRSVRSIESSGVWAVEIQHAEQLTVLKQRHDDFRARSGIPSNMPGELVHRCQFATRAQARAAVFEWIEIFYNRERLHSALGYRSPVDFETQLN